MLSSVITMVSSRFGNDDTDAFRNDKFIVIVEIKYFLNLNEYYLPIFILSIRFRQISFVLVTKDTQSNNNNNIVDSSGRAFCLLTLGHISAYNMDNTILLYKYLRFATGKCACLTGIRAPIDINSSQNFPRSYTEHTKLQQSK